MAVTAISKGCQSNDAYTNISIRQSNCLLRVVRGNDHIDVIGFCCKRILCASALLRNAIDVISHVNRTLSICISLIAGVVVTRHFGNRRMQAIDCDTNRFTGFVEAVAVTLLLCECHADLVSANHLIGHTCIGGHTENIVARDNVCSIDTICSGQARPGTALIITDSHIGNDTCGSRCKLQLTSVAGKVQRIKFRIPCLGCGFAVQNAALRRKAFNAEIHRAVFAAHSHHDQASSCRITGFIQTGPAAVTGHIQCIIRYFDYGSAFTQCCHSHPVAVLTGTTIGSGGNRRQADDVTTRQNIPIKIWCQDFILIGKFDYFPRTIALQFVRAAHCQFQVILSIDIQQNAVILNAGVFCFRTGTIVKGDRHIPLPGQISGLGNLTIHRGTPAQIICS